MHSKYISRIGIPTIVSYPLLLGDYLIWAKESVESSLEVGTFEDVVKLHEIANKASATDTPRACNR